MDKSLMTKEKSSLMNNYSRLPITFVKGEGSFVWDEHGDKFLDFTSGIAVCNLGHVPDQVKEKLMSQLSQIWHTSNLYEIQSQKDLANLLTNVSVFDQAFFCNSGAEANEAAIKLARIFAEKKGEKQNRTIVTFEHSFHGRTLGTLSATAQEKIQKGFAPILPGFTYLSYNDFSQLETLQEIDPIAVMFELVQGEGGVIPAEKEWIDALVSICKQNGILLIVDEVQTGMGRTGTLFAYEQYGFEPDVITLAKGLGSGFPIGAMLAKKEIAEAFAPGTHGSTFGGNPLAATAGLATLQTFISEDIVKHCEEQIEYLWSKLHELQSSFTEIKEIRGKGMLIGLVFADNVSNIVAKALEEKLLILSAGAQVVRLLPPLTVTKKEIDCFIEKMSAVLKDVFTNA
ncbi:acetylornithine transaminase [Heyndrickxia ginsengihumi]|uniref:Acetylornithine aminotransferase n=1 Tax=Heyndrickxia ginsengihumi TaxID=363870 RepID=A0A6M0P7T3_9BACI|nr:acetylornithine transaminase [Heyndrickxia ginsengihumi]MBE6183107.1 acetylornithine transaminase [Bacillus sp. (in: firmicutes)]MCM3023882.1 acetylornithine transaminase [Heyndrickxia ginsengihumi]NEY20567.1 acetylornithine transaminase [Heyndrickxia ginsengihumi]